MIGVDLDEELLREAQFRQQPNAGFLMVDLGTSLNLGVAVDGNECSFAAASFPDFSVALAERTKHLHRGG